MRGAKLFLEAVMHHGIDRAFGIVGGEASTLRFDETPGFNFYLTRHEFTAGMMADVYARLTGRPQMCYSTFGPGLTNMATGVCSAVLDRSPMLAVAAQIPRHERVFNYTHQCIDNVAVIGPMCKFAHEIDSVEEIPSIVTEALRQSRREVPGPSFISFPLDLMKEEISDAEAKRLLDGMGSTEPDPIPVASTPELQWLAEQIAAAKCPIVLAGNVTIRENATAELRRFLETWKLPLVTSLASKGMLPEDHPLHISGINKYVDGILRKPVLEQMFRQCDLMILLGYDFGEDVKPVLWEVNPNLRTLALGPNGNPAERLCKPERDVRGSLKKSLPVLTAMAPEGRTAHPELGFALRASKAALMDLKQAPAGTLAMPYIVGQVRKAIGPTGILCSDIGLHKQFVGVLSPTYEPNTFMCSNGCGSFGFGLPAGMAAKMANPDRKVAVICGDGGFHSVSQDLEAAKRFNLPMVIVVVKDNAFGLIKYYQLLDKDNIFPGSVEFGDVDFVGLARANGWKGVRVTDPEKLAGELARALESNEHVLLEVPVQYEYRFAAPTGGAVPKVKARNGNAAPRAELTSSAARSLAEAPAGDDL